MWPFYKEITLRALVGTPALVSSNWVAVGVSIAILSATFIIQVRRQLSFQQAVKWREKLAAMRDQWKQNLRDGVIITAVVWLLLFAVSFARTLYSDHQQISASASTFVQERNAVRADRDALRGENEELRKHLPRTERESADSLRRRTFKLADEFTKWLIERLEDKNKPQDAFPNSADPNPSEERKRQIAASQAYYRGIEEYYSKHFKDRFVGIVKEYNAKGVGTGYLESDFQRVPYIPQIGSVMEGLDTISRFRDLAYHVDARDHLIVVSD